MKQIIIPILILMIAFSACNKVSKENALISPQAALTDSVRDGIFIHITEGYNDPHRVLMPLKMAIMMAKDKDVLVYLDIHAVELVLRSSKDMQFADFDPLKKMLRDLIDKKVGVYACPTCLKISGHKPQELMEGIQVANKEAFFNFTKGRIITLDY
jgi:predicted peroxiredoxin